MVDLVGRIRVEQARVAHNIAIKLFSESYWLLDMFFNDPQYDREAQEIVLRSDLRAFATNSVYGYTDWLIFGRMLPVAGFDTQPLPQDSEIDYDSISVKRDVPKNVLRRVVEELHKQDKIPLVGEVGLTHILDRYLIPDKQTIRDYVNLF